MRHLAGSIPIVVIACLLTGAPASAETPDYRADMTATGRNCGGTHHSLVSRWSGEGDTLDSVGSQHGVAIGDVAYTPGVVGQAFKFSGDGYISVADSDVLDLRSSFTLTAWVKYDDISSFQDVLSKRPDFGSSLANYGINMQQDYGLGAYYDDPNYYGIGDDANEFEIIRIDAPPTDQLFHFAASVQQKPNNVVWMRLFVNGSLTASRRLPGNLATSVNDTPLTIGLGTEGGDRLVGVLDEVSIYDKPLSAGQISGLFRAQSAGRPC